MINTELAARAGNKKSFKILKRFIPSPEKEKTKIAFNCECADPQCKAHISLTLKEYEKLHQNFAHFVIVKGHVAPTIEKVKRSAKDLLVVEKPDLA